MQRGMCVTESDHGAIYTLGHCPKQESKEPALVEAKAEGDANRRQCNREIGKDTASESPANTTVVSAWPARARGGALRGWPQRLHTDFRGTAKRTKEQTAASPRMEEPARTCCHLFLVRPVSNRKGNRRVWPVYRGEIRQQELRLKGLWCQT